MVIVTQVPGSLPSLILQLYEIIIQYLNDAFK
jgi:hypothetical protein